MTEGKTRSNVKLYTEQTRPKEPPPSPYKDIEDYFSAPLTYNEKVVGIIVDLEHRILTLANEVGIEDVVRKRLQKSKIENLITKILERRQERLKN
jgi:hypothetical protein